MPRRCRFVGGLLLVVVWLDGARADDGLDRRWSLDLKGTQSRGALVVADGLLWVGANNNVPLDPAVRDDHAVLACFRAADGRFLGQHTSPRSERAFGDWPSQCQTGAPLVEGDRLYFCNNRAEAVALDIGPLRRGTGRPAVRW